MKYLFFFKGQHLPFHRRIYRRNITRRYFTESCKKIMGFCHTHRCFSDGFSDANTNRITDGLSARMSDTCPSARLATALPTSPTDGITDGPRMSDTCPSAPSPTEWPTVLSTDRKVWRDFQTFLVCISINYRRNYRRKLIAPTAIKGRR